MLAGKTVHQLGKESFTYPGGAGQQYVEPVRIKHRCAAFFYRITEAAIVANQAAEGIIRGATFLMRQKVGNRAHFTFGIIQSAPQQRFHCLAVPKNTGRPLLLIARPSFHN